MGTLLLWVAFLYFVVGVRSWERRQAWGRRIGGQAAGCGHRHRLESGWQRRSIAGDHARGRAPEAGLAPESPYEALKRRYVADEISVEEYERELDRLFQR